MLLIDIAGLTFHGQESTAPASDYLLIEPDGFTGWDDGVDIRRTEVERANAHGSFDAFGFLSARVASVSGVCIGSSQASTEQIGSRLTGLLAGGGAGRMLVQRDSGNQFATGRLAARTRFAPRSSNPELADFQIQMWFHNPRKYGGAQEFTSAADGRWTAYHRGNFDASPFITVTGNAPSYTIGGPNSTVYKVQEPVTPAAPHVIDLGSGQITVGGELRFGIASQADTWVIPSGQQIAQRIVPDGGTIQATELVRDTFI
ncbi:hypothetical protein [Frigoribacterium faeni]|uniref:Uncharacterized protein n=1 Tax=Frigoribacterium faeni TaxID=145483 RepID=A0A7W3JH15_9MICO|nr:hypothetical protein [Frigoribacterium faeni]MBA8812663.1 hypothetical protein [Frigoribacterium faeni]BFF13773.1 hypothetical protein GCM10025699_50760 [Microbacterium flavescens]GEK82324.1 hypothetical protein FFA01_06330 [Frigoribacterium faeni]